MFVLFALALIITVNSANAGETLNIATTEFCPYVCDPEKDGKEGFVIDIFKAIFENQGYAVRLESFPWVRTLKVFNDNSGKFDGLIAATKIHPINKDIAVFPKTEICMYTHKFYSIKGSPLIGTWKYKGIESLRNIRLGAIKGWSFSSKEVTKYVNETPEPYVCAMYGENLLQRNIQMLLRKRNHLYVENSFMISYFLYNEKKAGKKDMDKIVAVDDVPIDEGVAESYPVFYKHRNGQKYADIFTNGIKELRANGKLDRIMAEYGLKDWR